MKRRVVVTGLGVVTSLGRKVDTFWERVVRGESGVGPITLFDGLPCHTVANTRLVSVKQTPPCSPATSDLWTAISSPK